jgi:hypothetical protein
LADPNENKREYGNKNTGRTGVKVVTTGMISFLCAALTVFLNKVKLLLITASTSFPEFMAV